MNGEPVPFSLVTEEHQEAMRREQLAQELVLVRLLRHAGDARRGCGSARRQSDLFWGGGRGVNGRASRALWGLWEL